jgi:hypothetical protein
MNGRFHSAIAYRESVPRTQWGTVGSRGGVDARHKYSFSTSKRFLLSKNVVFWDATLCGSRNKRRFGVTLLHLQVENNQRIRKTLAVGSDCSTLRKISHYRYMKHLKTGRERQLLVTGACNWRFFLSLFIKNSNLVLH